MKFQNKEKGLIGKFQYDMYIEDSKLWGKVYSAIANSNLKRVGRIE